MEFDKLDAQRSTRLQQRPDDCSDHRVIAYQLPDTVIELGKVVSFCRLIDTAKRRWRIERDYQELKQELGLGHFEGRRWRGFHHHATLCVAAYGFLLSERETVAPSAPRSATLFPELAVPDGY